jgi:hypothetical protein
MSKMASSTRHALLLFTLTAVCGLSVLTADAGATASIERVWSFNGGAVDVLAQPNGTLIGVVSAPTKFAKCIHPVNEQMWIEMRLQPDGSYWGQHLWYFEPPSCVANPNRGPTAWRVLQNSSGEAFLRVCFSAPESNMQPTIAPDGTSAHATYGCVDSAYIAALPPTPKKGSGALFGLPSTKMCVKARSLKIKLHNPKYDPLKQVIVWVNGKKVISIHTARKLKQPIRLTHLPNGRFKVKILAITILNHRLAITRTYHSCKKAHNKHRHGKTPKHH